MEIKQIEQNVKRVTKFICKLHMNYKDAILCLAIIIQALQQAGKEKENGK